ncbi:MAG: two-component regulator propeller domain-containing protein [Agriterribacter sp.]
MRCVLTLCLLLASGYGVAQQVAPLPFASLTIDNGLSQGFVSDIVQDKRGLLWITTGDGLNSYDGYTFAVYHNNVDDTTSIASDDLTCVFEDSKQRLWIGTRNNGLDLFDRASNSFTHFRNVGGNGVSADNILSIREDHTGILWIRTSAGIDRMELAEHNATTTYHFTHIVLDSISQKPPDGVERVFIDSRNRVFIITHQSILEVLADPGKYKYRLVERYRFEQAGPAYIPDMKEDTVNHSLLLYNKNIIRFPGYDFNYPQQIFRSERTDIRWTIDAKNILWVADVDGITQLNLNSGASIKIIPDDADHIKAVKTPTAYFTDRTGVVWLGSGGYGILRYDPEIELFHHILTGENTYQLLEYQPGEIITNNFTAVNLNTHPPLAIPPPVEILDDDIGVHTQRLSLTKDREGNIWYAVQGALMKYDLRQKKLQRIPLPFNDLVALPFPLLADAKNNIWMGYKKYLVRFSIQSGIFSRYAYPSNQVMYEYDFLQSIFDDDGQLWLGSLNGLFCFDTEKEIIKKVYRFNQSDTTSISNSVALSFAQDFTEPSRYLWVGTRGGLNRLDKFNGKFTRYTTKQGLANNVVYGILPDYDNNLWLSTNRGMSAFNTVSCTFRNFDVNDGLQGNEFNRYAYTKTTTGLLVFGGLNGINYFNPRDIRPLKPPGVMLTELRLFNRRITASQEASPLEKDISFTNYLALAHEQNVVTLRFAAMDFRKHSSIVYRYKMEGFDEDWIYSGNINEATYTNLDPGNYNFLVEATFDPNTWSNTPQVLRIFVMAPWWQTWWFKIFVITGTVSVAYALYKYRIRQLLRLDSLRNRIARDLHDEVGSSISTIAIYSKIVHEQMENETFNNEPLLQKITDHATEIMESMNDIVWNINTKNDAFEHIISRMRENAFQLLEAKGYTLHFDFDEQLYQMQLPMEKRRDFYLVYKEAINNIAKYAEGKNVWITLYLADTGLQLMIKDDGKGFDRKLIRKGANGLSNMEQRAAMLGGMLSITAEPGNGTELRLSF